MEKESGQPKSRKRNRIFIENGKHHGARIVRDLIDGSADLDR